MPFTFFRITEGNVLRVLALGFVLVMTLLGAAGLIAVRQSQRIRSSVAQLARDQLQTTRGPIRAGKIGLAVAGNTSRLAQMAGIDVPIESHVLQAFVSEAVKPLVDQVITFGAGHFYISQSDKGGLVFGGGLDGWNSYAQRGNLPVVDHVWAAGIALMPALSRLRGLRQWGGVMDMSFDGSPIISTTPVGGLYLTAGWCYGGFKATPGSGWCHAWTIANDAPHPLNAPHRLDRFRTGHLLDERGNGPFPWMQ